MKPILILIGLIALIIAIVIVGPILLIWSLNTLFGLTIPFTLKTWIAALVLTGCVKGGIFTSQKN